MKAMIFAAGLGTRLKPLTDHRPKALVPIGGRPMLERAILRLKAAGFDHLIVNIHHFGQQIIDFLEEKQNFGLRIDISDEREKLLDTGGALRKAAPFLRGEEPFLVYNTDIYTDLDLKEFYWNHWNSNALATLLVSKRASSRFLYFDMEGNLKGWQNQKTGEVKSCFPDFSPDRYLPLAFGGIHVLSPAVLSYLEAWEEKFSIIDFYLSIAGREKIRGERKDGIGWIDMGKPETLAAAEKLMGSEK